MKLYFILIILLSFTVSCSENDQDKKQTPPILLKKPEVKPDKDDGSNIDRCNEIIVIVDGDITLEEKLYGDGTVNRSTLRKKSLDKILDEFNECEEYIINKYKQQQKES